MIEFRDYQKKAIEFGKNKQSVMIEAYMGTGKTLTAIGLADEKDKDVNIVIAPKNLLLTWVKELKLYGVEEKDIHIFNKQKCLKDEDKYFAELADMLED